MLQEKITKDLIIAMKAANTLEKDVLSFLLSKIKNKAIDIKAQDIGISDVEVVSIIQKMLKEIDEEIKMYRSANRTEKAETKEKHAYILTQYLPKMLTEQEIKTEINNLIDKSMPSIMKYFKTNFAGKVDMSLVGRIAKGIN